MVRKTRGTLEGRNTIISIFKQKFFLFCLLVSFDANNMRFPRPLNRHLPSCVCVLGAYTRAGHFVCVCVYNYSVCLCVYQCLKALHIVYASTKQLEDTRAYNKTYSTVLRQPLVSPHPPNEGRARKQANKQARSRLKLAVVIICIKRIYLFAISPFANPSPIGGVGEGGEVPQNGSADLFYLNLL